MHIADQIEIIRALVRAVELMAPGLTDDAGERDALLALLQVIDGKLVEVVEG